MPWKPATTTILPASSAAWMRSAPMRRMRARVCAPSVTSPTCGPVNEQAGWPSACSAIASSPMVTCSPVARSMSISRGSGVGVIAEASARSPSVVLPIAETTITRRWPSRAYSATRRATFLIFSGSATEEPPYFWTISCAMRGHRSTTPAGGGTGPRASARLERVFLPLPFLLSLLASLAQQLARALALLRGHVAPALEVPVEALALLRGQRLVALEALLHLALPFGRQPLVALVGALQLPLALLRQLVPPLEVLVDAGALAGRQPPQPLQVPTRLLPLLR